jgi:hypothetical protein
MDMASRDSEGPQANAGALDPVAEFDAERLRDRIRLMLELADAFEADAAYYAARADEAYERQKAGLGLREITVNYLHSRDEYRRSAKVNREDAAISTKLLALIRPTDA